MIITSSILFSILKKKYNMTEARISPSGTAINGVRFFRGDKTEPGFLYIADCIGCVPALKGERDASYLFYGAGNFDRKQVPKGLDFALVQDNTDGQSLFEAVSDIFQKLQSWDCLLKDALNDNMTLDEFMPLGRDVLDRPYCLLDRNLSVLFISDRMDGLEVGHNNILTPLVVNELLMDEEFHSSSRNSEPYIYPSEESYHRYLCINIFSGTQYVARGMFPLNREADDTDDGQLRLFSHFFDYVRTIYLKYADDPFIKRPTDKVHTLFRELLFEHRPVNELNITDTLSDYGWTTAHEYSIIKLNFFKHTKWDEITSYICSQLELSWPNSCALKSEEDIIWIFNHSLSTHKKQNKDFFHSLAYIVRDFVCRAGVSDTFMGFDDLQSYLLQASVALKIGQKKYPDAWYFKFTDQVLNYMHEQVLQDFTKEQLCHKGLKALMDYDTKNDTEYCKTLREYMMCAFNATEASNRLFVHRTTLIRRIERIKDIAKIDLDNHDVQIHLILSFWIMNEL